MSKNNIDKRGLLRSCTSCQMCGAVCPKGAIKIELDNDGFYKPIIEDSLCVDCGKCVSYCAKYDINLRQTSSMGLSQTKLYAASAKENDVVRRTTSGGIADLLAKELIKEGFRIIGVTYNKNRNRAEGRVAQKIEDTDAFRGSKYIQSYNFDAFRELVKSVRQEKYAVFGLPCQIYAISRYLESINQRDKCLLIDMYCHGCPSMLVWNKVSDDIRRRLKTQGFENVEWRSKNRGWGRFTLSVTGENGKNYQSSPMDNDFFYMFFSNQLLNESCSSCEFRSTLAYTDIRLGDFWGNDYKGEGRGVSAVSVVTERGLRTFDKISTQIHMVEKKYESFLPFQSWDKKYNVKKDLRQKALDMLRDETTTAKQCANVADKKSFASCFNRFVKQILSYLPLSIENKVYRIIG